MNTIKDKIEYFDKSLIQHGRLSDRIYLMKMQHTDPVDLINGLRKLAEKKHYSKIFAKVPSKYAGEFYNFGYEKEAHIPGFYKGKEDVVFLALYFSSARKIEPDLEEMEHNLDLATKKYQADIVLPDLPENANVHRCRPADAMRMSEIYKTVFPSYPFPIDDPDYIKRTMEDNIIYYGVQVDGELVSLASSEMDKAAKNVEFTDFATLPDCLGNSYAIYLLKAMEPAMQKLGIKTGYTIARAMSPGMNITFAKAGYNYAGRLINNTNISGKIESMNIWHKSLL